MKTESWSSGLPRKEHDSGFLIHTHRVALPSPFHDNNQERELCGHVSSDHQSASCGEIPNLSETHGHLKIYHQFVPINAHHIRLVKLSCQF